MLLFFDCLGGGERQRSEQPEQQALEPASWHQKSAWCLQETGEDLAGESALCGGDDDEQQPRKELSSCYPPLLPQLPPLFPWAGTIIENSSTSHSRAFIEQAMRENSTHIPYNTHTHKNPIPALTSFPFSYLQGHLHSRPCLFLICPFTSGFATPEAHCPEKTKS